MRDFLSDNLTHDPIHGYIAFASSGGVAAGETSERQVIDHPWVQRMRHIHQLQTAWLVFPSAEHTRFQHVLGVMHLASRWIERLYESLREVCPDAPSRGYCETLLRMAGLLHDVGHGPFGHFFDEHFLARWKLNHEVLGGVIIREQLGPLLAGLRRNPNSKLEAGETIDPTQIAWMILRPKAPVARASRPVREEGTSRAGDERAWRLVLQDDDQPRWLHFLRSLLTGIYTIDNMDFVLRDAYMSGYSAKSFDLDRLLHYSFFSEKGLTVHDRGVSALVRFMNVRAELFRTIYFHRTVRAIDATLRDLFAESREYLFPGNPLEHLDEYQGFTETSLYVDVTRWNRSANEKQRELGERWRALLMRRELPWQMACERTLVFGGGDAEQQSIFADEGLVEQAIRKRLPTELRSLPLRVDIARHIHRPDTQGPALGQNFYYNSALREVRPLTDDQLFQRLPLANRICRIYAQDLTHAKEIAAALDGLLGRNGGDDLTNM